MKLTVTVIAIVDGNERVYSVDWNDRECRLPVSNTYYHYRPCGWFSDPDLLPHEDDDHDHGYD